MNTDRLAAIGIERVALGEVLISEPVQGKFVVAFPDGEAEIAEGRDAAQKMARRWFKRKLGNRGKRLGIGSIEWLS